MPIRFKDFIIRFSLFKARSKDTFPVWKIKLVTNTFACKEFTTINT